jgi:NADPH:quinone reductase
MNSSSAAGSEGTARMRAVRYDRFEGIDGLYIDQVPVPVAGRGEVVVRVQSAALNPGALPALHGAPYVPGRDLAGDVVAVGDGVEGFAVGDAVLGRVQSWEAHAELVSMSTTELVVKPEELAWDVAGALFTTPLAGLGAVKAVAPMPGDVVVVSGASGGVGFTAAQLARRIGADVVGLTSARHAALLERQGIRAVEYGAGEEDRIRAVADGRPVAAFIDAVGNGYIELALRLGAQRERINTVVDYAGAKQHGVKSLGTNDAGGTSGLSELARLAAADELFIPIAQTYPLRAVQEAYRALAARHHQGRIVLHPQE